MDSREDKATRKPEKTRQRGQPRTQQTALRFGITRGGGEWWRRDASASCVVPMRAVPYGNVVVWMSCVVFPISRVPWPCPVYMLVAGATFQYDGGQEVHNRERWRYGVDGRLTLPPGTLGTLPPGLSGFHGHALRELAFAGRGKWRWDAKNRSAHHWSARLPPRVSLVPDKESRRSENPSSSHHQPLSLLARRIILIPDFLTCSLLARPSSLPKNYLHPKNISTPKNHLRSLRTISAYKHYTSNGRSRLELRRNTGCSRAGRYS